MDRSGSRVFRPYEGPRRIGLGPRRVNRPRVGEKLAAQPPVGFDRLLGAGREPAPLSLLNLTLLLLLLILLLILLLCLCANTCKVA